MKSLTTLLVSTLLFCSYQSHAEQKSLLSISKGDLSNEQITVIAEALVIYDVSTYTTLGYSQNLYDDLNIGASIEIGEENNEILSYAGSIITDDWLVSVEQSSLSGVIREDGAYILSSNSDLTEADFREDIVRFEDNQYIDLKFVKGAEGDGFRTGYQYMSYTRPSAFEQGGRTYVDPTMQSNSIGFLIMYDSVKNNLLEGNVQTGLDWYFYTTTAFVLTSLTTGKPQPAFYSENHFDVNLEQESWIGGGINGEYELGGVFYLSGPVNAAIKAGFQLQMESPLMYHAGMFDDLDDAVHPTEGTNRYGFIMSLLMSF